MYLKNDYNKPYLFCLMIIINQNYRFQFKAILAFVIFIFYL